MSIKERKVRKSGNSVSITLSREFLETTGIKENDTVYIDEEKLKEAIVKKTVQGDQEAKVAMLIQQSLQEYQELYQELVDK